LILAILFGLGVGYFVTQNTAPVTVQFGATTLENVPLYMVAVGSLLIGLGIAWLLYAARAASSSISRYGEHRASRRAAGERADLGERVRRLEAENEHLRTAHAVEPELPNHHVRHS
jgi:uncharacterized integral membrane protein